MKNRIADLYQKDSPLRFRMMMLPSLVTFLAAFVMLRSGLADRYIPYAVLSICGIIYAYEVLRYGQGKGTRGLRVARGGFRSRDAYAFALVSLLVVVAFLSAPIVQARALNLRLKRIATSDNPSPDALAETSKIISLAKDSNVVLSQDLIGKAQQKVFLIALQLDSSQFQERLPDFASSLSMARTYSVSLPYGLLEDLREKLSSSDWSAPGFWTAASEMVNYRPIVVTGGSLPPVLDHAFGPPLDMHTDCLAQPRKIYTPGADSLPPTERLIIWNDCTLDLDDVSGFESSTAVKDRSPLPTSLFLYRVKIVYKGGELIPATNMKVLDCKFDFEVENPPNDRAKEMFAFLLSRNYFQPLLEVPLVVEAYMGPDGKPRYPASLSAR